MRASLVMTVIGPDRPGLVESLATIVARHGGNWTASRMARLGGQFAGIVQADLPADQQAAAIAELNAIEASGLSIEVVSDRAAAPAEEPKLLKLELMGHDRAGIVRDLSHALAGFGVNVEELQTAVLSAPMSGEPMFQALALIRVPPACPMPNLRSRLAELAGQLGVEIDLREP